MREHKRKSVEKTTRGGKSTLYRLFFVFFFALSLFFFSFFFFAISSYNNRYATATEKLKKCHEAPHNRPLVSCQISLFNIPLDTKTGNWRSM